MKKIISLLLVTLLLVAAVPVFATGEPAADDDYKMILSFDEAADVGVFNHKWGSTAMTASDASDEYTKLSNYSAHWYTNPAYFNWKNQNIDITGYNYINLWIYSDQAISMYTGTSGTVTGDKNTVISTNVGWNLVTLKLIWTGATHHNCNFKPGETALTAITFNADWGATIPEGCVNYGTYAKVTDQPNIKNTNWYIDSIFLSKNVPAVPIVTPSIQDEANDVSCNITEYALSFDTGMKESTLTTDNIKIKETVSGKEVTPLGITPSSKAATLTFAEGSFVAGVDYTVTVSNAVESAYGLSVGDNVAYTFATAASTETPVATMVAPAANAIIAKNNAVLTASAVPSEGVNKVEFYEEAGETDTLLGTGVKGANDTYSLNYADFAGGDHTVYAVVTYNSYASTTTTSPVTFNVAEIPAYALSGISNGETVYANRFNEATLTKTIGLNTTDYVSEVTYFVDGDQKAVATSPTFTYDVEIADFEEHTISATVVDVIGGTHNLPAVTYSAGFLASGNAAWTNDFDESTTDLYNQPSGGSTKSNMTFVADPAETNKRSGNVAFIDYTGSFADANDDSCFVKNFNIPASKQVRIDFDFFVIDADNQKIWMNIRPSTYSYNGFGYTLSSYAAYYNVGAWNEASVLIDYSQAGGADRTTTYKLYINGVLAVTKPTNNTQFVEKGNKYTVHFMSQADYYLDNVEVYDYAAATLEVPSVGNVSFASTETGWDADVVLANNTNVAKECTIITAVYDAAGNLIATNSKIVTIPVGEIIGEEYTVAKTHNDKLGTKVRAFVWESVEGELTLRPLAEIN